MYVRDVGVCLSSSNFNIFKYICLTHAYIKGRHVDYHKVTIRLQKVKLPHSPHELGVAQHPLPGEPGNLTRGLASIVATPPFPGETANRWRSRGEHVRQLLKQILSLNI